MNKKIKNSNNLFIDTDFFEEKQAIMTMSPKEALNFILNYKNPEKLVRSFPEESLYFLLHSIGMEKSSPVLALASNSQWEYFLDIDIWEKESLNYFLATKMLILMMNSNPDRFARWCFYDNFNLMKIYFYRNILIQVVDPKENFCDLEDGFFTYDGVFYFKFINYTFCSGTEEEEFFFEKRNEMLNKLFLYFSSIDNFRLQGLLMETNEIIPCEVEEDLLRLRNIRILEKGFLPFCDAIGIYQPLEIKDLNKEDRKISVKNRAKFYMYPLMQFSSDTVLNGKNLFFNLLQSLNDNNIWEHLQVEFVKLCNVIISADNYKVKTQDDLKKVVIKISNFLSIGIELILEKLPNKFMEKNDIIKEYTLGNIFRVGYGEVFKLRKFFLNWYKNSWFISKGFKLYFWGEYWFGVLGCLLLDKPKFFKYSDVGREYSNFRTYSEIIQTKKIVEQVMAIDSMLNLFDLEILSNDVIDIKILILTLWSLYDLGFHDEKVRFHSIPIKDFKKFYNDLWEEKLGCRKIKKQKKIDFLLWIADRMTLTPQTIPNKLNLFFESLFDDIESELKSVLEKDLDPRYLNLFLVK